jgi:peptidoglycan hydrolase-like protein with peptidoglycan-binding domain
MPRTLSLGMQGDDVTSLQQLLNYHLAGVAPAITVNGNFDNDTDNAVRTFQSLNTEMPDPPSAAAFGNTADLVVDGIVGPKTRAVLLDARAISFNALVQPADGNLVSAVFRRAASPGRAAFAPVNAVSGRNVFAQVTPVKQSQPAPVPLHRQFQLFAGQQINLNPWSLQPLVITGQFNWLAKRDGAPDFVMTLGGQVSFNQVGGPNGTWTGQGFAQMGLNSVFSSDLLNPFVVAMLQKNQGQPFSVGVGLGNQMNYNLTPNGSLSLFLNTQVVVNTDLTTGLTSVPGLQILGGVGFTFDSTP